MLTTVHPAHDHRIYHKEAKTLADEGHDVRIIAMDREVGCVVPDVTGIDVVLYPGRLTYACHISNCIKAFTVSLSKPADVVHAHEPSSLFIGCLIKGIYGSRLVYDRHEYYPELMREKISGRLGRVAAKVVGMVEELSELYMMGIADRVIVVDDRMGFTTKHNAVLHNYPTTYTPRVRSGTRFGYVGVLSHRKIKESIDILSIVAEHAYGVTYDIAGSSSDVNVLPTDTDVVTYHGVIPHIMVPKFLDSLSWGMCLYEKIPRYDHAVSTKTFEYIMSGIPVIASRTPGNQFIEDEGYGILIDPDDIYGSADAIIRSIPKCQTFSENCLQARFGWESDKLIELYRSMGAT